MSLEDNIKETVKQLYKPLPAEASDIDLSSAGKLAVQVGLERFAKLEEYNRILQNKLDEQANQLKLQQLEIDHQKLRIHDAEKIAKADTAAKEVAVLAKVAMEAKVAMLINCLNHMLKEAKEILEDQ